MRQNLQLRFRQECKRECVAYILPSGDSVLEMGSAQQTQPRPKAHKTKLGVTSVTSCGVLLYVVHASHTTAIVSYTLLPCRPKQKSHPWTDRLLFQRPYYVINNIETI